ncbi:hypothetical protein V6N13_143710 [Hibiscus sabdariffa]
MVTLRKQVKALGCFSRRFELWRRGYFMTAFRIMVFKVKKPSSSGSAATDTAVRCNAILRLLPAGAGCEVAGDENKVMTVSF